MTAKRTASTVEEFERMFDDGEADVTDYMVEGTLRRLNDSNAQKPVSITLPAWLLESMDAEAVRRGTSRASVMKNWLVDRADLEAERRRARVAS